MTATPRTDLLDPANQSLPRSRQAAGPAQKIAVVKVGSAATALTILQESAQEQPHRLLEQSIATRLADERGVHAGGLANTALALQQFARQITAASARCRTLLVEPGLQDDVQLCDLLADLQPLLQCEFRLLSDAFAASLHGDIFEPLGVIVPIRVVELSDATMTVGAWNGVQLERKWSVDRPAEPEPAHEALLQHYPFPAASSQSAVVVDPASRVGQAVLALCAGRDRPAMAQVLRRELSLSPYGTLSRLKLPRASAVRRTLTTLALTLEHLRCDSSILLQRRDTLQAVALRDLHAEQQERQRSRLDQVAERRPLRLAEAKPAATEQRAELQTAAHGFVDRREDALRRGLEWAAARGFAHRRLAALRQQVRWRAAAEAADARRAAVLDVRWTDAQRSILHRQGRQARLGRDWISAREQMHQAREPFLRSGDWKCASEALPVRLTQMRKRQRRRAAQLRWDQAHRAISQRQRHAEWAAVHRRTVERLHARRALLGRWRLAHADVRQRMQVRHRCSQWHLASVATARRIERTARLRRQISWHRATSDAQRRLARLQRESEWIRAQVALERRRRDARRSLARPSRRHMETVSSSPTAPTVAEPFSAVAAAAVFLAVLCAAAPVERPGVGYALAAVLLCVALLVSGIGRIVARLQRGRVVDSVELRSEVSTAPESTSVEPEPSTRRRRPLSLFAARVAWKLFVAGVFVTIALVGATTWVSYLTDYRAYVIVGRSMEPALGLGSVAFSEQVKPSQVRKGDILTYSRPGQSARITHRVVEIDRTDGRISFKTRGDANGAVDPWTVAYAEDVAWRVKGSVPYVGHVIAKAQTRIGRALMMAVPVMLLLLQFLRWLWKPQDSVDVQTGNVVALPTAEPLDHDRAA